MFPSTEVAIKSRNYDALNLLPPPPPRHRLIFGLLACEAEEPLRGIAFVRPTYASESRGLSTSRSRIVIVSSRRHIKTPGYLLQRVLLTKQTGRINLRKARHVTCTGDRGGAYSILVGKSDRDNLEDLDVDGWIMLKWICKKLVGGVGWFDLVQDTERWRALVNAVVSVRISPNAGNSLTSWGTTY
jgi:hypothetical protein